VMDSTDHSLYQLNSLKEGESHEIRHFKESLIKTDLESKTK